LAFVTGLGDIHVLRVTYPTIPASTFRRWAHEGRITARGKQGRRKLYDLAEVDAVVSDCRLAVG
jgi:hypothetical protein